MTTKRKSLQGAEVFLGSNGSSRGKPKATKARQKHASTEEQKNRSTVAEKRTSPRPHQKVGYYLPPHLVVELEEVWLKLRSLNQGKITKSDIVRAALEDALAEFREHKGAFISRLKERQR